MRELILKNKWAQAGASFAQINGAEAVSKVNSFDVEYDAMRQKIAFADFSFCKRYEFSESEGLEFLDKILAENIQKLRYGKICDTFLAEENGSVAAECFVANIDDKIYLIAESIAPDSYLDSVFLQGEADAKDISADTVLLSVDGPEAWKVARDICGQDALNLSYLSIETYSFEGENICLMRNGKTGEFGYQFLAPKSVAEKLFDAISVSVLSYGGALCGTESYFNARLEGNFFNVYAEGAQVKNPLALGLQWMIDIEKESFIGSENIFKMRENPLNTALVGLKANSPEKTFQLCESIYNEGAKVASIVAHGYSKILNSAIALAIFDSEFGLAGFEYSSQAGGKLDVSTISMPPIVAKSLITGIDS